MIDYSSTNDLIDVLALVNHAAAVAGLNPRQARTLTETFIADWHHGSPDPEIQPMRRRMLEKLTVEGDESDFSEDI